MKQTQLYQGPQSPLIQGRSRRARPFWQAWLGAWLLGAALAVATAWLATGARAYVVAVVGASVGSALGVSGGRAIGTRRAWISGGIVAFIVAMALFAVLALWFPQVLSAIGEAV